MTHFPISDELLKVSFPIWDGPVPLSRGTTPEDIPTLTPFWTTKSGPPAPVMLIYPGGGYAGFGFDRGICDLAERFQQRGFSAFLLRYRVAPDGYRHPTQLLDAQRALRLIRHRAAEWNLDPARIVVMGFSAGGHLASMVETHFDAGDPHATDPVDRHGSRPDAAILIYPVISLLMKPETGSHLLGPNPHPALVAKLSSETQVTPQTPPTLLVHGEDDDIAPVENSRLMFAALQKAGVPSEFHAYPVGKHGFGSFENDPSPPGWLERMDAWLESHGFVGGRS
jgi:acetyl esterase/lipase